MSHAGAGDPPLLAPLQGATVVLGVSGGIAAYKAVELCRRLVDAGAHVVAVLTPSALRFVGEATFSALASEPAQVELFGGANPIPHTDLGRRADLVVIAPATARVIGSYAAGISSDLLVATLLATRAPVLLCPAMHTEMWEHPAVKDNLATLRRRGVHVLEPATGHLAGGDVGAGRLPETAEILHQAATILSSQGRGVTAPRPLAGRKVLITAGGTREPIDPVRYLSNRSSGRQGHALAEVAAELGAEVTLVTASELPVGPGIEVVAVETAAEMASAVLGRAELAEVVIMAAAVADYRPAVVSEAKLHRKDGVPEIRLVPTKDILAELSSPSHARPGAGGLCRRDRRARPTRSRPSSRKKGSTCSSPTTSRPKASGFPHETNAVTILRRGESSIEVPLQSKRGVARAVLARYPAVALGPRDARPGHIVERPFN